MATIDVFNLFATITLDTGEYEKNLDGAGEKTHELGQSIKNGLVNAAKVGAAALTAASAGVAALTKASLDNYAEYEQLVGGIETLFGAGGKSLEEYAQSVGQTTDEAAGKYKELMDVQETALQNAANAYKTAGLSANDYMETITGFAASLKQSLGEENFQEMANMADMAISDMADNANKMGTTMDSIQNAYQGFAKQNYTMLDNLKLGYGGTKEEMQRLLADAEKLGGYMEGSLDISNFADIVEAIHIVQENMGITGTTAKEAASTIQGSTASMKAAWENLVTGIGDENADLEDLIGDFVESVGTAGENIIPRVEQILVGIGSAIGTLAPVIAEQIPGIITTVLPTLLSAGGQLLGGLATGILGALPTLTSTALPLITEFVNQIIASLPEVAATGIEIITSLVNGITEQLPELIPAASAAIMQLVQTLTDPENLENIFNTAVDLITSLVNGLAEQLPELIPVAVEAVLQLAESLTDPERLGEMVDAALNLITSLATGLIDAIPVLVEKAPTIIGNLVDGITENLPKIAAAGLDIIKKLAGAIVAHLGKIWDAAGDIVQKLVDGVAAVWDDIVKIGSDIVGGIWEGIQSMFGWLGEQIGGFFGGIIDGAKNFLGIASPSKKFRDEIGHFIALGVAAGINDKADEATKSAEKMAKDVYSRSKEWADRQTKYMGLSLDEQIELWETIRSQFIGGSKQYADAEEKIFDLKEKRAKEAAEAEKERLEEMEKAQEEYAKKVADTNKKNETLEANYQKTLAARAKEIVGSYALFAEVPRQQKVSGQSLLNNLSNQISNIEKFYENVDKLAERGLGEDLVSELRDMGPSAFNEISALLSLSDEKLTQYGELWEKKQDLAQGLAEKQLSILRDETEREIEDNLATLEALSSGQGIETTTVDFAASGLGKSSAAMVNNAVGTTATVGQPLIVKLVLPDGKEFASWQLPYLIREADAAGTPIASGQHA